MKNKKTAGAPVLLTAVLKGRMESKVQTISYRWKELLNYYIDTTFLGRVGKAKKKIGLFLDRSL